jgi:hypothetical protein
MLFIVHHHHITAVPKYNPQAIKNNVCISHKPNNHVTINRPVKKMGASIAALFHHNT